MMNEIESLFDTREPEIGTRVMTLARQRLFIGYVKGVVQSITDNTMDARTLEALRRSGKYILQHPEPQEKS